MGQKQNQYKLRFGALVPPVSQHRTPVSAHTLDSSFQMRFRWTAHFSILASGCEQDLPSNSESMMISALAGMLEAITLH